MWRACKPQRRRNGGRPSGRRFRRTLLPPALRGFLLAGCYAALEAVADADVATSDWEAAESSLAACVRVLAAVTPGSDLHAIVAASRLWAAQQVVGDPGTAAQGGQAARSAAAAAHAARYGPISEALTWQLADLNRQLYH